MKGVTQLVNRRGCEVRSKLNPVYFTFFANKLAQQLPTQFLGMIYKLKKVNEICAH